MTRLLVLATLLLGCSTPTELLLVVKADSALTVGPGTRSDIDALVVHAQPASDTPGSFYFDRAISICADEEAGTDGCQPQRFVTGDYEGALTLPVRLLLVPGSQGIHEDVRVWVDGLVGGVDGTKRLASGLVFRFVEGRRLYIELPLFTACVDQLSCQANDLVCGLDGRCGTATTGSAPHDIDEPRFSPDFAMADLAPAVDLSTPDLASPDLGPVSTPCGGLDQICCGKGGTSTCNGEGLVCNNKTCVPCGGSEGALCCNDGCGRSEKLACGANGTCVLCGEQSGRCCTDTTTNTLCHGSNLACATATETCDPCGGEDQICCTDGSCPGAVPAGSIALRCGSGAPAGKVQQFCTACGADQQTCCVGNSVDPASQCAGGEECLHISAPNQSTAGTCTMQ